MRFLLLLFSLAATAAAGINDFSCRSESHPNPVVFLHGLFANKYEDLNLLQAWLSSEGYCTFALTYGEYDIFPFVGGLKSIDDSAPEIANYIRKVVDQTGASKVDLVGHSEGAFQTLFVPKFEGVASLVDQIVAIAPPTHGTTLDHLYQLAYLAGGLSRELVGDLLATVGCGACNDLGIGGPDVGKLDDGPIVQPGNRLTVIASRFDELVTPPKSSFVHEDGVNNLFIQDFCPKDHVGHIAEAYDMNVWNIVRNVLEGNPRQHFACSLE